MINEKMTLRQAAESLTVGDIAAFGNGIMKTIFVFLALWWLAPLAWYYFWTEASKSEYIRCASTTTKECQEFWVWYEQQPKDRKIEIAPPQP